MEAFNRYSSQGYAPSAPPLPPGKQRPSSSYLGEQNTKPTPSSSSSGYAYSHPSAPPPPTSSASMPYGYEAYPGAGAGPYFPPGTHPWIIQSFQSVDRDRSGSIDEMELQTALSTGYQKFSLRTIRLLMFLFRNPDSSSKIGPMEFAALWDCLGQWRNDGYGSRGKGVVADPILLKKHQLPVPKSLNPLAVISFIAADKGIFERFDRDRSGEIDSAELRDALYSLGYAVPDSVIQVLMSKYKDGSGRRGALNFDSFVECGMIVKGLTEKFKAKDPRYTGSATLSYDTFMSMIIPFLVA